MGSPNGRAVKAEGSGYDYEKKGSRQEWEKNSETKNDGAQQVSGRVVKGKKGIENKMEDHWLPREYLVTSSGLSRGGKNDG